MTDNLIENKRFNLLAFLGYFAWLFIGSSLFVIPLIVIGPKLTGLPLYEYIQNVDLMMPHAYIPEAIARVFAIFVFIIFFHKIIKLDAINFKNNFLKYLIIVVVGFVIIYLCTILMNYIYELLGYGEDDTSSNQQGIIDALNGPTKHVVVFLTVILAPIIEEIIFRKLFYNALKMNTKLPSWAIVLIIAAVFAGIHVMSDIESLVFFPQYFVLSFIITGVYAITKENIFASIGLHFLNNLLAILQILL